MTIGGRSHLVLPLAVLAAFGLSAEPAGAQQRRATASLTGCDDAGIWGEAVLREQRSKEGVKLVTVRLKMGGLPEGKHAVHIHETAACRPCTAAEGHFDPGPESNSSPDGNHPFHMGDLINIEADDGGLGVLRTQTTRITLSDGPLSIFAPNGNASSAFIVHTDPDSYCPDGEEAGCAGGGRIACGIIRRQ